MGLHDDHRKRLREQYAKNGMGSLTEERLLELILFTPIPRKDTYDISKRLLSASAIYAVFLKQILKTCRKSRTSDSAPLYI